MEPPRPRAAEALEPAEVRALLRAAFRKDPRRGWTLMLLYATGARIGSLVAVMPEDVAGGYIRFNNMKGRHGPHDVPLSPLAQIAARHLAELGSETARAGTRRAPRPTLIGVDKGALWYWVTSRSRRRARARSSSPSCASLATCRVADRMAWTSLRAEGSSGPSRTPPRRPPGPGAGLHPHPGASRRTPSWDPPFSMESAADRAVFPGLLAGVGCSRPVKISSPLPARSRRGRLDDQGRSAGSGHTTRACR
jgi:hypothetical protein